MGRIVAWDELSVFGIWDELSLGTNCRFTELESVRTNSTVQVDTETIPTHRESSYQGNEIRNIGRRDENARYDRLLESMEMDPKIFPRDGVFNERDYDDIRGRCGPKSLQVL